MKIKHLLIIGLLLGLTMMPHWMLAQSVSRNTAKRVAEIFLNQNVRGGDRAAVQLEDITAETEFQNFYIFSADSGFVIVAADERVTPILGYSKIGRFVTEDMPENLRWWLHGYEKQIQEVRDNNAPTTLEIKRKWMDLKEGRSVTRNRSVCEPLLHTDWGQGEPYCLKCPSAMVNGVELQCCTGCTATAMAQVMKYWDHPYRGNGSHTIRRFFQHHTEFYPITVNFANSVYDWSNMPNKRTDYDTEVEKDAVSTLMYHCGVSVNTDYDFLLSTASSLAIPGALNNFFYYKSTAEYKNRSDYNDVEWVQLLKNELNASPPRPVIYGGTDPDYGGHCFVCDGYDENYGDDYFHFNWGWNGDYNYWLEEPAYYCIDRLYADINITQSHDAIVGIEPDEGTITVSISPDNGGVVAGAGVYRKSNICTLTATPNPGYIFKGWYTSAGLFPVNVLPTFTFPVSSNLHLIAKFQAVNNTTETYQYYCWFDQDYSTVLTGSFQTTETFFALDASSLSDGLHTLHVMLEDDELSSAKTYLFLKTPVASPNATYQYHCWYDQDYGSVQTGTFGGGGFSFALDTDALEEGLHTVHVMLEGTELSSAKTYLFLKTPVASPSSTYQYHCWFDHDYETVQTGTFGGEGYSFALDADELEDGLHTLHVMLEGTELSSAKTYLFLKTPVASPSSTYQYHCWFDHDYETVQTGTFGGDGYCFALDATNLEDGLHTVHVMLEGTELSSAKTYLFLKTPAVSSTSTYQYHCWFDNDYNTVQLGTFGGDGFSFVVDASELDNGLHFLNVMLEGSELSSAKRYLFYKTPSGGDGIARWEYCINGNWSESIATNLVPTVETLDIISLLPVAPQPISSQSFQFEINGGQPEIYAKNTITFRFWDSENRFLDHSALYVDATVHENVVAEWIERNTTKTIVTPGTNQIHWFKLDASVGDLLEFMADHECTIELFTPSGNRYFSSMSVASIVFNGTYAPEDGIYYLAVHDVEEGFDSVSITYRFTGATTQSIALAQGWNWWAPTVQTSLSQLEEALANSGITIVGQADSASFVNGQWEGTLDDIVAGKMYKIQTAALCSFTLRGIQTTSVTLSITPGLNWFGFIGTEQTSIGQAIGISSASGDKIISQDSGFAIFNGVEWQGTLTQLLPGHGYVYYNNSGTTKVLQMGQ